MKYTSKNGKFYVGTNESADKLLCILGADNCMSESVKDSICAIVYYIVGGHIVHDQCIERIESLIDNMRWLTIFSEDFIKKIEKLLLDSVEHEKK